MIPLETWLAFVVASTILVVIPGPTITLVISYALAHGKRSAWATVRGVALDTHDDKGRVRHRCLIVETCPG